MKNETREHDLTRRYWGHNYEILDWTKKKARLFVWLTPGPREGDVLLIQGKSGPIRAEVVDSEWQTSVDDMYLVKVKPA